MISNEELRNLAEFNDNRPSFLCAYLNLKPSINWTFINSRKSNCLKLLTEHKILTINEKNFKHLERFLKDTKNLPDSKAIALFIFSDLDYFKIIELDLTIEDEIVIDSSPYIRPLVELEEENEAYCVLLIDLRSAQLFRVCAENITGKDKIKENILGRTKKGGWSQMRYQRRRQKQIDDFCREAIKMLEEFLKESKLKRVVLAGVKDALRALENLMPNTLKDKIIGTVPLSAETSEHNIVKAVAPIFQAEERREEAELVKQLKSNVLRGELATIKPDEIKLALENGQVETLVISKGAEFKGYRCLDCNNLEAGMYIECNNCGSDNIEQLDFIEELVEMAQTTSSNVEFVEDNQELKYLGGLGALLRYKIT